MEILKSYNITDKRDRYNLCKAQGINLSDLVGQRIEVKAYMLLEEADNQTGELRKTLKILTPDGEIIGTRSRTFISDFCDFLTFMEDDAIDSFGVEQKRSSSGRNYLVFKA